MMEDIMGFHVTSVENFKRIKKTGLKGSKWQSDFSESISDPFRLYKNGAVFAFLSLSEARRNRDEWDAGSGTVILRVKGKGVRFEHYAEGEQVAIRANTAAWKVVD